MFAPEIDQGPPTVGQREREAGDVRRRDSGATAGSRRSTPGSTGRPSSRKDDAVTGTPAPASHPVVPTQSTGPAGSAAAELVAAAAGPVPLPRADGMLLAADGLDPVRALAQRLRAVGVLGVAAPIVSQARPAGISLLSVLGVLTNELANEWRSAAEALPVLHPDRLQLHSAAALLKQGASAADRCAVGQVDGLSVARGVALREAVQAPDDGRTLDEGNVLLDLTWAVLHDLRRYATADHALEPEAEPQVREYPALVHAVTDLDVDDGTRLPIVLDVAATAGALVGLLAPWLPIARVDPVARIDLVMNAVSSLARRHQDHAWWLAMTEVSRAAASLGVASTFAVAAHAGTPAQACAQVFAEQRFGRLVDESLAAVRPLVSVLSLPRPATPTRPLLVAAVAAARTGQPAQAVPEPPLPSPSQQARAAAERAAAERVATQQAFVERAWSTRAAARASNGTAASGLSSPDDGAAGPPAPDRLPPDRLPPDRPAARAVPTIAQVRVDLGEAEVPTRRSIWDTLMGPR